MGILLVLGVPFHPTSLPPFGLSTVEDADWLNLTSGISVIILLPCPASAIRHSRFRGNPELFKIEKVAGCKGFSIPGQARNDGPGGGRTHQV